MVAPFTLVFFLGFSIDHGGGAGETGRNGENSAVSQRQMGKQLAKST